MLPLSGSASASAAASPSPDPRTSPHGASAYSASPVHTPAVGSASTSLHLHLQSQLLPSHAALQIPEWDNGPSSRRHSQPQALDAGEPELIFTDMAPIVASASVSASVPASAGPSNNGTVSNQIQLHLASPPNSALGPQHVQTHQQQHSTHNYTVLQQARGSFADSLHNISITNDQLVFHSYEQDLSPRPEYMVISHASQLYEAAASEGPGRTVIATHSHTYSRTHHVGAQQGSFSNHGSSLHVNHFQDPEPDMRSGSAGCDPEDDGDEVTNTVVSAATNAAASAAAQLAQEYTFRARTGTSAAVRSTSGINSSLGLKNRIASSPSSNIDASLGASPLQVSPAIQASTNAALIPPPPHGSTGISQAVNPLYSMSTSSTGPTSHLPPQISQNSGQLQLQRHSFSHQTTQLQHSQQAQSQQYEASPHPADLGMSVGMSATPLINEGSSWKAGAGLSGIDVVGQTGVGGSPLPATINGLHAQNQSISKSAWPPSNVLANSTHPGSNVNTFNPPLPAKPTSAASQAQSDHGRLLDNFSKLRIASGASTSISTATGTGAAPSQVMGVPRITINQMPTDQLSVHSSHSPLPQPQQQQQTQSTFLQQPSQQSNPISAHSPQHLLQLPANQQQLFSAGTLQAAQQLYPNAGPPHGVGSASAYQLHQDHTPTTFSELQHSPPFSGRGAQHTSGAAARLPPLPTQSSAQYHFVASGRQHGPLNHEKTTADHSNGTTHLTVPQFYPSLHHRAARTQPNSRTSTRPPSPVNGHPAMRGSVFGQPPIPVPGQHEPMVSVIFETPGVLTNAHPAQPDVNVQVTAVPFNSTNNDGPLRVITQITAASQSLGSSRSDFDEEQPLHSGNDLQQRPNVRLSPPAKAGGMSQPHPGTPRSSTPRGEPLAPAATVSPVKNGAASSQVDSGDPLDHRPVVSSKISNIHRESVGGVPETVPEASVLSSLSRLQLRTELDATQQPLLSMRSSQITEASTQKSKSGLEMSQSDQSEGGAHSVGASFGVTPNISSGNFTTLSNHIMAPIPTGSIPLRSDELDTQYYVGEPPARVLSVDSTGLEVVFDTAAADGHPYEVRRRRRLQAAMQKQRAAELLGQHASKLGAGDRPNPPPANANLDDSYSFVNDDFDDDLDLDDPIDDMNVEALIQTGAETEVTPVTSGQLTSHSVTAIPSEVPQSPAKPANDIRAPQPETVTSPEDKPSPVDQSDSKKEPSSAQADEHTDNANGHGQSSSPPRRKALLPLPTEATPVIPLTDTPLNIHPTMVAPLLVPKNKMKSILGVPDTDDKIKVPTQAACGGSSKDGSSSILGQPQNIRAADSISTILTMPPDDLLHKEQLEAAQTGAPFSKQQQKRAWQRQMEEMNMRTEIQLRLAACSKDADPAVSILGTVPAVTTTSAPVNVPSAVSQPRASPAGTSQLPTSKPQQRQQHHLHQQQQPQQHGSFNLKSSKQSKHGKLPRGSHHQSHPDAQQAQTVFPHGRSARPVHDESALITPVTVPVAGSPPAVTSPTDLAALHRSRQHPHANVGRRGQAQAHPTTFMHQQGHPNLPVQVPIPMPVGMVMMPVSAVAPIPPIAAMPTVPGVPAQGHLIVSPQGGGSHPHHFSHARGGGGGGRGRQRGGSVE